MLRRVVYLLSGLAFAMIACSNATDEVIPSAGAVCIRACITDNYDTRTSMSGSTASFISGDNIGIYETLSGRSNVSYTYNGTVWGTTAPLYWRDGTSNHTFYAYHPYNAAVSGTKVALPILSTQTMASTPSPQKDMLVTGPLTQKRSAGVGLTFKHAFSLIQFNIQKTLLGSAYTLQRITIRGGNTLGSTGRYGIVNITGTPSQVGYDMVAGSIQAATNDSQSYAQSFYSSIADVLLSVTPVTFYAFILPGTYTDPNNLPAVSLNLALLNIVSTTKFSNLLNSSGGNITFQPGMKYVFNITVGLLNRSTSDLNIAIAAEEPVPY